MSDRPIGEVEQAVLDVLGDDCLLFPEVQERVDAPDKQVETALRRLLHRQEITETEAWEFCLATGEDDGVDTGSETRRAGEE